MDTASAFLAVFHFDHGKTNPPIPYFSKQGHLLAFEIGFCRIYKRNHGPTDMGSHQQKQRLHQLPPAVTCKALSIHFCRNSAAILDTAHAKASTKSGPRNIQASDPDSCIASPAVISAPRRESAIAPKGQGHSAHSIPALPRGQTLPAPCALRPQASRPERRL